MFRVLIDYAGEMQIADHWYGDAGDVPMPKIPGRNENFHNVISVDPRSLPLRVEATVPRIYLPHRFDSDYGISDLFFRVRPNEIEFLSPLGSDIAVYPDTMDSNPRAITFERLAAASDPASARFDPEQVVSPHHQLGGRPLFIQPGGHEVSCLSCELPMVFLLQFQSDENLVEFEDDGCAYFWWCGRCSVVGCHTDSL